MGPPRRRSTRSACPGSVDRRRGWSADPLPPDPGNAVINDVTQVRAQIKEDHKRNGLVKPRAARKVHAGVEKLLSVPHYADLLGDQNDEDENERGRLLVQDQGGWRAEHARWIGLRCEEEEALAEADPDEAELPARVTPAESRRLPAPKPVQMTLKHLFGCETHQELRRVAEEQENMALLALYAQDDEDQPDDGAIEIDDAEAYAP
ncbi:hypothetical protein GGX14DRAFT_580260 [Mycena pura]|uniref:Uncharacterized protein n=1 Tax=Mycena pura TaxID=153505 RepID=A0AAD6XXT4_9AGAR|nr:hypothetical protein GGX14DRAFT_580260 [Mycena pura]